MQTKGIIQIFPHTCIYHAARRRAGHADLPRGLTLIELLVVLVILGLLATALLPSVHGVMSRAQWRDVQERLLGSWKLARALALAANQPMLWKIHRMNEQSLVTIQSAGPSDLEPRTLILGRCNVEMEEGPAPEEPGFWQVVVPPHGLTDSITLRITRDDDVILITLPGIIEQAKEALHEEVR